MCKGTYDLAKQGQVSCEQRLTQFGGGEICNIG